MPVLQTQHRPPPLEFSPIPARPLESRLRHRHSRHRQETYDALRQTGTGPNRLERFTQCGNSAWVEFSPSTGRYRCRVDACRDRWCEACSRERGALVNANLTEFLRDRPARLITLTLRHQDVGLKAQVDRLRESFRRLCRHPFWRSRVSGTIAILELTLSEARQWHPHLHVIALASWIDQKELGEVWHRITGDSYIVHVRWIDQAEQIAGYLAKYLTKPLSETVYKDPERFREAIMALKGTRLWSTTGACRGIDLDAPPEDGPDDWLAVGRLTELVRRFLSGEVLDETLTDWLVGYLGEHPGGDEL